MKARKAVILLSITLCFFPFSASFSLASETIAASGFGATPEVQTGAALKIQSGPAIEPAPLDENIVYSEEELSRWFDDHYDEGGTVKLGATITITQPSISAFKPADFIIETGAYGLVYDGAYIFAEGNLTIVGEGVDRPVLDVVNTGGGMFRLHWIHIVQPLHITATGKDGAGGVAVRVSQEENPQAYFDYITTEGSVSSYGVGAVGLELLAPSDVYCLKITAAGEGSTAVKAHERAEFYYCKLSGEETVSGNGPLLLDTCALSKTPKNAQIIQHTIASFPDTYVFIQQNEMIGYIEPFLSCSLKEEGSSSIKTEQFPVVFEKDPNAVDTSVLGKSKFSFSLAPPFRDLGLEGQVPLTLTLDVRDPAIPCIQNVFFLQNETGRYVALPVWNLSDFERDALVLWRSDNLGESWYDYTHSPQIGWGADRNFEWEKESIYFYFDDITAPVQFQLELPGAGESNVVTLYLAGEGAANTGGDRTGADRIIITPGGEKPGTENPGIDPTDDPLAEDPAHNPEQGQDVRHKTGSRSPKASGIILPVMEAVSKTIHTEATPAQALPHAIFSAAPEQMAAAVPASALSSALSGVPPGRTQTPSYKEVSAGRSDITEKNLPQEPHENQGAHVNPPASGAWLLFALLFALFACLALWRIVHVRR